MSWKENRVQDQRLELVGEFEAGEFSRAEICRRYNVSRKTGYKWYAEYQKHGAAGLVNRSRKPHSQPGSVDEATVGEILELRAQHPSWGERKLHAWLERERPEGGWPRPSTIGAILKRYGLTIPPKRRRRASPSPKLAAPNAANQVWAIDFKGWFRTGDGRRCDPLTLTDTHTRYLLRCQAVDETSGAFVRPLLEAAFREYGLPLRIRSDNGAPFASTGIGGLSRLSVWWVRLGITPERIEPGHPEQNGRHERMHRTLKQETAQPPKSSLRAQQRAFNRFKREYNEQRPHEALGMATPASLYLGSTRPYPRRLPELEYPAGYALRRVELHGAIHWRNQRVFLGEALARETVGIEELEHGWRVWLGPLPLAWMDARQLHDSSRRADSRGRSCWKALFLDGSARPPGSRRRPKTESGKANKRKPPLDPNP